MMVYTPTADRPRTGPLNGTEVRDAKLIINNSLYNTIWSKDVPIINSLYWYVPVFLYGPEKTGFSQNKILDDFNHRCGTGFTSESYYVMRLHDGDPIVFCQPENPIEKGQVHGEFFMVSPSKMYELDAHFQNGFLTRRMARLFRMRVKGKDDAKPEYQTVRAFMWTALGTVWQDKMYRMNKVTPFRHTNDAHDHQYYVYTKQRDQENVRSSTS